MRPLVVLLLVLGSLGALFFALTAMSDARGNGDEGRGLAVAPPVVDSTRTGELVAPRAIDDEAAKPTPSTDETRQEVLASEQNDGPLVEFGSIVGLVITQTGAPIPEAVVSLINARPSSMGEDIWALRGIDPPRPIAEMITKEDGTFRFDRLDPRKDWSLSVKHEQFLSSSEGLAVTVPEGGMWEETVILEPGQTCTGVVRDAETLQPIVNAVLVVDGPFASMNRKKSPGRKEAVTDETGAYVFTNVGSANQARVLTVSARGYATQIHSNFNLVTLTEPPTRFKNVQPSGGVKGREQDFALEPGRVIAGRAVGPDGRGVKGIEIEALSQSGTITSRGIGESSAKGEFLIEGLAEGIYVVRVTAGRYDSLPLQRIEAGTTDLVLELFEQSTVTGRVVDPGGQPLSSFTVKARTVNDVARAYGSIMAERKVSGSKNGNFELHGVPEGEYVIEATAEDYAASFSDSFTATQGLVTSDIVVKMSLGGSISGLILEGYGSSPVVNAEVSTQDNDWIEGDIWEMFGAMEPSAFTKTKTFTDANGRYTIDLVTPGTYQLRIKAKGYTPFAVKDVVVAEGQDASVPPQILTKGAVIRGRVLGANQTVLPGARVQLTPRDQNFQGQRSIRANGAGRFLIENVHPGTYELSATRPNSASGNPFESIGDMRQSKVEVSVEDGQSYDFDLTLGSVVGH